MLYGRERNIAFATIALGCCSPRSTRRSCRRRCRRSSATSAGQPLSWVVTAYLLAQTITVGGGRQVRRPVRTQAGLPDQRRDLHPRLGVVRRSAGHDLADHLARRPGHRGRRAAGHGDRADRRRDPAPRPRPLPGRPRRGLRRDHGARPVDRRASSPTTCAGAGRSTSTCRSRCRGHRGRARIHPGVTERGADPDRLSRDRAVGIGTSCWILATSWGGTTYAWGSATIIGLFVAARCALAAFVLVERRGPRPDPADPAVPGKRVFAVCSALAFVVGFTMLGAMTFLPTFLQCVEGVDATVVRRCACCRWSPACWSPRSAPASWSAGPAATRCSRRRRRC